MSAIANHFRLRPFPEQPTRVYRTASALKQYKGAARGLTSAELGGAKREQAPIWLDGIYSLVARDQSDAAIDILFPKVDELFRAGRFDAVEDVLRAVDVARLNTSLMVAVLAITRPAREKLPQRDVLLRRIERRLGELEPDRVERLLRRVR